MAARGIQSICLEGLEDSTHSGPCRLCIGQDIAALLGVDARDTVPGYCQLASHDRVEAVRGNISYRRLLDRRSDIGAAGSMMVSHVFTTSTSSIALREIFFSVDFEPSVATSLVSEWSVIDVFCGGKQDEMNTRR